MTTLLEMASLPQPEKAALTLVRDFKMIRRETGFRSGAGKKLSLDMARRLISKGLARQDYTDRHPRLVVTGAGKDVLDIIDARKRRWAQ